jgi:hypothetical protein
MNRREFDTSMSTQEALNLGLVMRTWPRYICGDSSPESHTLCELEPEHTNGWHEGHEQIGTVSWA